MKWTRITKTIVEKNKVGILLIPDIKSFYKTT